jgi:hypothetical protein
MAKRGKKKGSTAPDGFPEKAWNKLSESWRDAAQSKQTEELEQEIIKAVRSMSNTSFDMKNDNKLKAAQEDAKLLKSGYTEEIGGEKAKLDFCVYIMNTRGAKVSSSVQKAVSDAEDDVEEADAATSD